MDERNKMNGTQTPEVLVGNLPQLVSHLEELSLTFSSGSRWIAAWAMSRATMSISSYSVAETEDSEAQKYKTDHRSWPQLFPSISTLHNLMPADSSDFRLF